MHYFTSLHVDMGGANRMGRINGQCQKLLRRARLAVGVQFKVANGNVSET